MSDARFQSAINAMNQRRDETGLDMGGKKYSMVKDRVEVFRSQFGAEFGIDTDIDYCVGGRSSFEGGSVVVGKAKIRHTATGNIVGSGHAMAFFGSDPVNTGSIVEAVETAAIGRALASFGLHGGEYASGQEMDALTAKQQAAVNMTAAKNEPRKVKQGSKEPPQSEKEREFREAVDKHFPPSVSQYNFIIPDNVDPNGIDVIFTEIDRIGTVDELTAYWTALEETFQWVKPEDMAEITASFKSRNKQLKGM